MAVCNLDTSLVWKVNSQNKGKVLMHPFIIGELACGNLHKRQQILMLMENLSKAKEASNQEVLYFIENNPLMGNGIRYIDVHLLASTALTHGAKTYTYLITHKIPPISEACPA